MKKNMYLVIGIATLFVIISITPSIMGIAVKNHNSIKCHLNGKTWYVGGNGSGNFSKIQDAIDNASDEDTIFVFNGTYNENIKINKAINLIGEDRNTTIINGNQSYTRYANVEITRDGVNLCEFTITANEGVNDNGGIAFLHSDDSTIYGNIIDFPISDDDSTTGIYIECATRNTIKENIINNCTIGIEIWYSSHITISENIIKNSYVQGITVRSSGINTISNNIIADNRAIGINIGGSSSHIISGNNITNNGDAGIHLYWSSGWHSIYNNDITNNKGFGIEIILTDWRFPCLGSEIYHNNFIGNNQNAFDECNNDWFIFEHKDGFGNYWDDYEGFDTDGDGIGDTPYSILGGKNKDKYPFMTAFGIESDPPQKPNKPSGKDNGTVGTKYWYYSNTTDPNGDIVRYLFDWGDGTSTWTGYYDSGETAEISHKWIQEGNYTIKVKARDAFGYESEWSNPLTVTMPRSRAINGFFLRFLEQFSILQKKKESFV